MTKCEDFCSNIYFNDNDVNYYDFAREVHFLRDIPSNFYSVFLGIDLMFRFSLYMHVSAYIA